MTLTELHLYFFVLETIDSKLVAAFFELAHLRPTHHYFIK